MRPYARSSVIAGTPAKKGWFRSLARDARGAAAASAVTVLSRQLVAGVLVSDLMLGRVCAQAAQSREQILGQLTFGMPRQ